MNILILGDSWANGAYDLTNCQEPTHPGLEYYLSAESGHTVTNLAVRAGGNYLSLTLLQLFLEKHPAPDYIIFMQASFMREYIDYQDGGRHVKLEWLKESNLNWNALEIEEIIKPNLEKTCIWLKSFNIPTIVIGGNTKVHPIMSKYFDGIHTSATELVDNTFKDSFFDSAHELELFNEVFFKKTKMSTKEKYRLAIKELQNFKQKYDYWHSDLSSEYINEEHGTTKLHYKLYQTLLDLNIIK